MVAGEEVKVVVVMVMLGSGVKIARRTWCGLRRKREGNERDRKTGAGIEIEVNGSGVDSRTALVVVQFQ